MVIGSFLFSAVSFLLGILGIATVWPALANTIYGWFKK